MKDIELINKYGTPFYLYDIPELKKRVDMMKGHQEDIGLCYAMKASPVLAGYIAPFVDRLEVCSPGEYEICVRDKVAPEKILVSGVNKTKESMMRILSLGGEAGMFTIESREHLNILEEVAGQFVKNKNKLKCYIRLTSGNQFGVDKDTLEELAGKVMASEHLEFVGIHFFSGTQKNLKKIEAELTELTQYGVKLSEKFGGKISLEYGPGLSIDYFNYDPSDEKEMYLHNESYLTELMDIVDKTGIKNSYSDITFEYGRYIVATCGKYFTGIADVKTNNGTNYAILEGGLHQITYFGSMAGMKVPYIEYMGDAGTETQDYVLAGSLCSVNDILVRKISLPKLDIGDTLCFNIAGAYCATEGISLFLSRDIPAIVIRDMEGTEKIVRNHTETNTFNGGYNG